MPTFPHIDIEDLSAEHVLSTPQPYDWQAWHPDDSEERPWDWAEVVECPKCKRFVVACNGQIEEHNESEAEPWPVGDDDDAIRCNGSGEYSDSAEGPMMSYWYPCTFAGDMVDAARALDGCVCVVTVDGAEGIALTGGRMDLSWEICEAYIRLGHLPPVHYARDLPTMAGKRLDARHLAILKACESALQVARSWLDRGIDDIARHRRIMSESDFGPDSANLAGVPGDELQLAELASRINATDPGLAYMVDQIFERGYVDDHNERAVLAVTKGGKRHA